MEVVGGGQRDGFALTHCVDSDDGVDGLLGAGGVVLPHGDDAAPPVVDHHVGVPYVAVRSDGFRRSVMVLAVEALVGVVGEEDRAVLHGVVPAAVLVDPAAGVESRWVYLRYGDR